MSCPRQFEFLSPRVRVKAITIGNALLRSNVSLAHAELIACDRAVDWARIGCNRVSEHHVIPYRGGWAIQCGTMQKPVDLFSTQDEALRKALQLACGQMTDVVLHGLDGSIIYRCRFA